MKRPTSSLPHSPKQPNTALTHIIIIMLHFFILTLSNKAFSNAHYPPRSLFGPTTLTNNTQLPPQRPLGQTMSVCFFHLLLFVAFSYAHSSLFRLGRSLIWFRAPRKMLTTYGDAMLCCSDDQRCPICYEDFVHGDGFFHAACLDPWLLWSPSLLCPICRHHAVNGTLPAFPNTFT